MSYIIAKKFDNTEVLSTHIGRIEVSDREYLTRVLKDMKSIKNVRLINGIPTNKFKPAIKLARQILAGKNQDVTDLVYDLIGDTPSLSLTVLEHVIEEKYADGDVTRMHRIYESFPSLFAFTDGIAPAIKLVKGASVGVVQEQSAVEKISHVNRLMTLANVQGATKAR